MKLYITRLLLISALVLVVSYVISRFSDGPVHFSWGKETLKALLLAFIYTLFFRSRILRKKESAAQQDKAE